MTTIERYRLRRLSLTPGRELPSRLADVKELPVILIEAETADGTTGFADTMLIEGITPETPEQGWIIACKLAEVTAGMRCADDSSSSSGSSSFRMSAKHASESVVPSIQSKISSRNSLRRRRRMREKHSMCPLC